MVPTMPAQILRSRSIPTSHTAHVLAQCQHDPLVLDGVRPDLCEPLMHVIFERMKLERRSTPSLNIGGWKSSETLFTWRDPAVSELNETIAEIIGAWPTIGWAMVNQRGSQHPRHQHMNARLVGVWYVTAGSEDAITPTTFETKGGAVEVEPHPGRLVLSPGAMWHRVDRYDGDEPRVSVAFDLRR